MKLPVTITTDNKYDRTFLKDTQSEEYNLMMRLSDIEHPKTSLNYLNSLSGIRCVSLHSPFINNTVMTIEECLLNKDLYKSVIQFASKVADLMNTTLPLVFHTNLYYNTAEFAICVAPHVQKILADNIDICIENGLGPSLHSKLLSKDTLAIPHIVDIYNAAFNAKYFYTCLDICHATITMRYMAERKAQDAYDGKVPTISDYCRAHGEDCKLIHLANTISHGLSKGYHAAAFYPDKYTDVKNLRTALFAISKYNPNAKVVLEVCEEDYKNRPNVKATLTCLDKYF